MNKKMLALITLVFCFSSAFADANYECVTDLVSGIHYNEKFNEWENATYLPGERFVITKRGENSYHVKRLGLNISWSATCTRQTDQTDDSFSCMDGAEQFHFNRQELRFTAIRSFGYWNGSNDSVSISIGRCVSE